MKRSYDAEMMDDFSIQDERIDKALHELKIINKFLGGIATTKSALKHFAQSVNEELKILDIGSGSSDNLVAAKNKYPNLQILSIDKNLRALSSSENFLLKVNSDAFGLPFKNESHDIIHAALFLHHFTEEQIQILLKEFLRTAARGIIINDLQRSYLALLGIKILTVLFSKSEMVKNDGPLSVKRGFTKKEFLQILANAGIANFIIKRKWAFRWMVVIKK
ncbi:MAG TPA: methyltransferase domain-containing protein [Ignavibacteriaceae bacterium]|nr:methyltransferase domain-containing protein [Ignavibacteriaceae bacterium]